MQANAKITARLMNPEGLWEREIACEFPDISYMKQATLKLLISTIETGGLLLMDSEDEAEFVPMHRVQDIKVKLSTITIISNLDLAKSLVPERA